MRSALQLSVIVPVHNGAAVLTESLPAVCASDLPRSTWELIVVDDASTDDTAAVASEYADKVLRLRGRPHGPAYARNRGCEAARGDILVFVDADVCVHGSTLRQLVQALTDEPDASAVFGAYDTAPRSAGLVSQYRNLLHHYVHTMNAGDADTFWAGCGAIRRAAFIEAGGFDEQRYPRPQIEDIALGYRLRSLGHRLLLRPRIQATHLKHWTLGGVLRSDLFDRGVPWMQLLLAGDAAGSGSLNVRHREKLLTGLAGIGAFGLLAAPFAGAARAAVLAASVLCLGMVTIGNLPFLLWCARLRGAGFALGVLPLHLLHYIVNAVAVGVAAVRYAVRSVGRPDSSTARLHQHVRADTMATESPAQRHAR
jgi:hypothetical protein